ncbi:MAG TPA: TonB-dependent receptor, partial [Blastocatellia bacterium]|nr:TonB-dependent receptor [Blastocatellia bacterium]
GQGNPSGISIPGGLFRLNSATNGRGAPYTAYTLAPMDNLSVLRGNHSLKFGGEVRFVRLYTNRLGGTTYSFSNLANFLTNTASTVQYLGDESSPSPFNNGATGNRFAKQEYYIGYAQDEFRIKPNLTFNYGLRYEYYSPLREDKDRQVLFDIDKGVILQSNLDAFKTSKTNFAPRLSVAWSPYQSGSGFIGGGKTVIRAGFGINYGPGQVEDQIQPIESDRINSTFSSGTFVNPAFPANIPAIVANFNTNPNNRSYQPRAYDRANYEVPERIYSYTVSVQQELPYKMALTLAYVGSQGRNLFLRSVSNQIIQVRTNASPANAAIVIREFSQVTENGPGTNPTVQNPFAEVDYKTSGGHDSYNAAQVSLARRFNTGVTLNAQYTYGTSRGNTAGSNEALTSGNNARRIADFDYDDGYNNFDVRHTFNFSAIYALPFGKGLSGAGKTLLGGWELGTIVNSRSGLPIPVQITRPDIVYLDPTTGIYYGGPAAGRVAVINKPGGGASRNISRPDLVAGVNPFLDKDRQVLNPAAFAIPKPGTFGNLERNLLHGPRFFQQDVILAKKFILTESTNLEFRSEFFNIFNGTNFATPPAQLPNTFGTTTAVTLQPGQPFSTATATSAFGLNNRTVERVVGLGTNRQIQFALRLNF